MKILQVIDSLNIGGAEKLLTNFLLHSSQKDISYEVCVLYNSNSFLKSKLEQNNIIIHSLNLQHKYDIRGILTIISLLIKNKYDLVHVHLFPAIYFCALASLFTPKIEYVYTEHSTFNRRRTKKVLLYLDSFAYSRYSKIISVCNVAKEELIKHFPYLNDKIKVVYNGIPIVEPVVREEIYDVLLVGSMRSAKAIDVFIKAINNIKDKINVVAIAGDGVLKDELMNLRDNLGLREKIEFLGNRSDIDKLLEQSKIFVLSSKWEGIPISILEAMSKAKPIVCTNVGGIPEIIDSSTGILVDCDDKELSLGIGKVLDNEELAEELGQSAYNHVQARFSMEKYTQELEEIYYEVLI
jgi:glycosyltransferase involved in cell wall biosynthesis